MAPTTTAEMVTEMNHMLIEQDAITTVEHDTPIEDRAEAGFDLTDFGSSSRFRTVLEEFGLDPQTNSDAVHAKVDKDPDDPDREYGAYVWANEHVAIITGNNPITGFYSDPEMRSREKGYASYIGLSGDPELVDDLFELIKNEARMIKGEDPRERQFI